MKGKVYLVGAGPGDIGLLTVKGLRCLKKAEVVVYDFHINAQILNYISHDAEFIYCGKRGGHHEMTQEEINQALVGNAEAGRVVCRLKGGDPFVFGRGGEEAEALAARGIEFEIVPGVSSSVAAPAYAGIPLTHRDYSSSFSVITGNEALSKTESSVDWARCARQHDTLVFLMAVRNLRAITATLMENGLAADTPAAVVRWGTRPDQKTVVSTLGSVADLIQEARMRPPAVLVVGEVVRLRDVLSWYEKKPLFGQRVLITREYTRDYEPLEDLGAEIFEFPTIEIAPPESLDGLDSSIRSVEQYHWLVVTSANGWRHFIRRFLELDRDIRDLKGLKLCAIGTKTAEAVRAFGIKVDLIPEQFNAEGLIQAFSAGRTGAPSGKDLAGVRILLPRAELAREIFPRRVRELGGQIDTPVAYRALKPEKHAKRLIRFLKEGRISIATFTSAATFDNFVSMVGDDAITLLRAADIAAIGPVTSKAIEKRGLKVGIVPREATISSMVDEIIRRCGKSYTISK